MEDPSDEVESTAEVEITLDNVDEDLFIVEDSRDLEAQADYL